MGCSKVQLNEARFFEEFHLGHAVHETSIDDLFKVIRDAVAAKYSISRASSDGTQIIFVKDNSDRRVRLSLITGHAYGFRCKGDI